MNQEIFKASFWAVILFPIFFVAGVLVIYFVNGNISPLMLLIFLIIPISSLAKFKEKLLIENDTLRYQRVFSGKEVSLKKVSQIVMRSVRSTDSDDQTTIQRVVYVVDESGRTFFSFPGNLIKTKDLARFEEAVTAVNPTIKVS